MVNRAAPLHLRLMATTDLHGHLVGFDYYTDQPNEAVGLTRVASLIGAARGEAVNTLLLDNGDLLQGNPLADHFALENGLADGAVHPMIAALNALGCAAGTLGNHEFNYGLPFLERALAGAAFPMVCANLLRGAATADALADDLAWPPYAILERRFLDEAGQEQVLRLGIIGFLPPQTMLWDARNLDGFSVRDMVEAGQAHVPALRAQSVDLVIALAHTGIAAPSGPGAENAALALAHLPGIDVLITGHQHRLFPGSADFDGLAGVDAGRGTLAGRPAVMAGCFGSHLGLVDLTLVPQGAGWHIERFACAVRPIAERSDGQVRALVPEDAALCALAAPAHQETRQAMGLPVGETAMPLFSWFSLVAPDAGVAIVAQAQRWYARRLLAGTPWERLPVLSAAAPFKAGGRMGPDFYTDIPAGPLALRHLADLYLFPNTLSLVTATGAAVADWLERAASIFAQIEPGSHDRLLLQPFFPSYDFDALDGLTWSIDVSRPAKYDSEGLRLLEGPSRIGDLAFEGRPLAPDETFLVVTNNHRAGGSGLYAGMTGVELVISAPDPNRDALVRYVREERLLTPPDRASWRFRPIEDASALFETGPGARAHADAAKAAGLEFVGPGENGFERWRKRFG